MEKVISGPTFYRAEDFAGGLDGTREVAGWVGYTVSTTRRIDNRKILTEEMIPVFIGAHCPVFYQENN